MRGTWGETRKRQTTHSFGSFEDIFSEPVASCARRNGGGRGEYIYLHSVSQIRYFLVVYLVLMHEDEFTFLLIVSPLTSIIEAQISSISPAQFNCEEETRKCKNRQTLTRGYSMSGL